jgi:hypothetical protein
MSANNDKQPDTLDWLSYWLVVGVCLFALACAGICWMLTEFVERIK